MAVAVPFIVIKAPQKYTYDLHVPNFEKCSEQLFQCNELARLELAVPLIVRVGEGAPCKATWRRLKKPSTFNALYSPCTGNARALNWINRP